MVCSETGKDIIGEARYYASYTNHSDELVEFNISSEVFGEPLSSDHLPLVYFRISSPLKDGQKLPMVDLS